MEAHLGATHRNSNYRLSSIVEHHRTGQADSYQQIDVVGGRPNRALSFKLLTAYLGPNSGSNESEAILQQLVGLNEVFEKRVSMICSPARVLPYGWLQSVRVLGRTSTNIIGPVAH